MKSEMTPELWQRLKPLYDAALDTPLERRAEFVAQACGEDTELRREFEALLAANDDDATSFDHPVVNFASHLPPSRAFVEGQVLLGRFRVVRLLGHGGMGEVYEVEDRFLQGVHVAMKTILPHIAKDQVLRRGFEREVLLAREVTHPNLCPIYDLFQIDEPAPGLLFLTMKLLPGSTLSERLKQEVPISPQDRVAILKQTSIGLAAIHRAGIIHRDIKTGNVMLDGSGANLRLWITDFGLARAYENASTVSMPGAVAGTPGYLAPELFLGHLPSRETDLFALGVMLHEVFTGDKPASGPKGSSRVISSRLASPNVPSYCTSLIAGCLSHDPVRRSEAFAQALEQIEPKSARRNPWLTKQRAWIWPLALVAALILAYLFRPTLPPPSITAMTQLTHGGDRTLLPFFPVWTSQMQTDGARIYFAQASRISFTPASIDALNLAQVSVEGGESVPVQGPPKPLMPTGISANGTELLVLIDPSALTSELWNVPVSGGQPRRIGKLRALDAVWSQDRSELYYSTINALFRAKGDGTEAHKILTLDGLPFWIRAAPDGRTIRFSLFSQLDGSNLLWEAQTDGSHLRQVLAGRDVPSNACCGNWTGDGKYFIFQERNAGTWNLWTMREKPDPWRKTNYSPTQLTLGGIDSQSALPSKDGRRVYFIGTSKRSAIIRFDQKKQRFVPYLTGLSATGLAFTKDGKRVAYVSVPEGILWQSKADGSDPHQLTFPPMQAELPRWSPDSKQIAFTGTMPGKTGKIYLVPSGGGTPEQMDFGSQAEQDATWAPDGNSLAFSSWDSVKLSLLSLQILNLTTRKIVTAPGSEGLWSPRWSPDGRYLLASSTKDTKQRLFDFNTRSWQTLGDFPVNFPNWTKDGKCIYYEAEPPDLATYRICLKDRKPVVVVNPADGGKVNLWGMDGWIGLAPDESILGTRDASFQEIYALDVKWP